jgi:hypothetical protein
MLRKRKARNNRIEKVGCAGCFESVEITQMNVIGMRNTTPYNVVYQGLK